MTPSEYEDLVGDHFRKLGYAVEDRPPTNDWGIDLIATKGGERIAVQAKMYGGSPRPVNRAQLMELHGAAAYFDCTQAVLATNGRVLADAAAVAAKLNIEILRLEATARVTRQAKARPADLAGFDQLWERYIVPLAGKTLSRANGKSNKILAVDWAGVDRLTSTGAKQRIKIEIFRLAVDRVLADGHIFRNEINAMYPGRASSGVVLILSQIPGFEYANGELRQRR